MAEKKSEDLSPDVIEDQAAEEITQDWMDDLQIGLSFLTLIPIPGGLVISNPSLAQSTRFFPLIGAVIGIIGVVLALGTNLLGLPLGVSIIIALLSMALITGSLHEDGLIHTANTIAKGGVSREERLEILEGNQLGTTGILVLIFTVTLKWIGLSTVSVTEAIVGLFLMAVISRGGLPVFMRYMPNAKNDLTSMWVEQPEFDRTTISVVLSLMISFFAVGFLTTISIIIVLVVFAGGSSWLLTNFFGGKTSRVLGALQQISEICIILTITVLNN